MCFSVHIEVMKIICMELRYPREFLYYSWTWENTFAIGKQDSANTENGLAHIMQRENRKKNSLL